jgi:outer membrane murein-binding lipoprotein Lpp
MGLGNTAKKLQKVADMAEDVYAKLKELRQEVNATRETVEETAKRTTRLEDELAEQRALIDRLLEANGIDPATVDREDAEPPVGGDAETDDMEESADGTDETSGDTTTAGTS